jgi:hypothetical protein
LNLPPLVRAVFIPHIRYPRVTVTHDGKGEGADLVDVFEPIFGLGHNRGVSFSRVRVFVKRCAAKISLTFVTYGQQIGPDTKGTASI